jgi:hypothetical protein
MEYVSPIDTRVRKPEAPTQRPLEIAGRRVWLLDIAKNRSAEFLDRIEQLLRSQGAEVRRARKPTFSKPAPQEIVERIALHGDLAVEALAD